MVKAAAKKGSVERGMKVKDSSKRGEKKGGERQINREHEDN